ncbi:unnamed protein product [Caenorhabditis angaria]|uniref:Uncharacterized protein n=1 Tax=Caenorhabditis angaria TaxID=860376 RepID=A0A9P1IVG7_9PELO|nr:unnamed protein product [Caenorhabditis angaria]
MNKQQIFIFLGFVDFVIAEDSIVIKYFGSWCVLIGLVVFTALVGVALAYACYIDIKHWKRSIDLKAQEDLPKARREDFIFDKFVENQTQAETTKSRSVDRTEKQVRIINAIYTSSNREPPKNLKIRSAERNTTKLETISETQQSTKTE